MKQEEGGGSSDQLGYEELSKLCASLQDRVTRGIRVQQQLNSIKTELDRELNRFKVIQEFSQEGLFQERIESFATLATEYFVQAFEQPHCLFAEYNIKEGRLEVIGRFGFPDCEIPQCLPIAPSLFPEQSAFLLSERADLKAVLSFLGCTDALIAPLRRPDKSFGGLVLCGQQEKDLRFYPPINSNDRHSFTVMATKASYLLYNFRTNELLKQEIRERRRVEKELEAKADDLMRSNAELEQFAYVVSHDLKAPLRNVQGFAEQLLKFQSDNISETTREYIGIIGQEVDRFSDIIDDLLRYARVSSSSSEDYQEVVFSELIDQICGQLSLTLEQQQAEIVAGKLPVLRANRRQMQQLFQNLIVNALKFTRKDFPPRISIAAEPLPDGGYRFAVQDNGIGLEQEELNRIFLLFKRGIRAVSYEGSGLGLSICKKIVEQHQGRIWAESAGRDKGTTFFFTLPA